MKILFWGNQALGEKKTGVGWYNYNLLKEIEKRITYYVSFHKRTIKCSDDIFFSNKIIKTKIPAKLFLFLPIRYDFFFPKVDIFYFDGFFPLYCKGKKIAIVHDLMGLYYPENYSFLRKLYLKYYLRAIKKADRLVVVSENTKKDLVKLCNVKSDKIKVIYPGVDLEKFKEKSSNQEYILEKYGIKRKYFLYMGALRKNKNVDGIIKSYKKYLNYGGKNELVIAGGKNGEYLNLKKLIKSLELEGRVIFTGYFPEEDKVSLYKNAEVFLMPSLYEGFGIPVIEAMAAGIPVITSKTSSLREIAEGSGLLVNPEDTEEISRAMVRITKDRRLKEKLITEGIERAKMFNWKHTGEKFIELVYEVLD